MSSGAEKDPSTEDRMTVLLEWVKDKDKKRPEVLALIAEDFDAQKIIAAWPRVPLLARELHYSPAAGDIEGAIQWCWNVVRPDDKKAFVSLVADVACVSQASVAMRLDMLMMNRLVYPDNTVNAWALKLIQERVKEKIL